MHKIDKKLNILISCGSYAWGGLEMETLDTALKLKDYGLNAKIVCSANSQLEKEAIGKGIGVIPLYSKNINIPGAILKLKKYLKNNETDIVHSNHSHDLSVLTPALNGSGKSTKLFLTKHVGSGVKKTDPLHKYLYKRLDGIFAISNYILRSIKDTCPVPDEKIHLLPLSIDMEKFDASKINKAELKKELSLPEDKLIIGVIGRMTPGKGHEEFLEAANIINKKYSDSVHFIVIGGASFGEEKYGESIEQLSEKLEIKNITFTGFTFEPQRLMGVMDILAFPSHNESFGRVLLEAMALKIPLTASGNAGVVDIVIDNETGLLFEPKNSADLARKLTMLIDSGNLRNKFSENGYKRAQDVFAVDIMMKKLIKYYTD